MKSNKMRGNIKIKQPPGKLPYILCLKKGYGHQQLLEWCVLVARHTYIPAQEVVNYYYGVDTIISRNLDGSKRYIQNVNIDIKQKLIKVWNDGIPGGTEHEVRSCPIDYQTNWRKYREIEKKERIGDKIKRRQEEQTC